MFGVDEYGRQKLVQRVQTSDVDLDGTGQIILDANGDTIIDALNNDQIDIAVGGTDRIQIDSQALTVKGGLDIYEPTNMGTDIGLFKMLRNQYGSLNLLGHFKSSLPSGHGWAGSPFATSPTVSYPMESYCTITTDDTDGAFLNDAPTGTLVGKYIAARCQVYYDAMIGVRIDDGTTSNYIEWVLIDSGSGYLSLRKSDNGTTVTYDVRADMATFVPLAIEVQDRGSGNWRCNFRVFNEYGGTAVPGDATSDHSWTISRVGAIIRPTVASTRGGRLDWLASSFSY